MKDTLVFVVCTVVLAGFLIYAFGAERREYAKRQLERQELCLNQAQESNFSPGICGNIAYSEIDASSSVSSSNTIVLMIPLLFGGFVAHAIKVNRELKEIKGKLDA